MNDTLRAAFDAAHADLLTLLDGLTEADWERKTATTDGWTIRDTIGHLASGEAGNQYIARTIRDGGDPYRPDFDLARFNRRNIEKSTAQTAADNLAAFNTARAATLTLLDEYTTDDLDRAGRRTTGEATTVAGVFQRLIDHEREHTAEIRAALR